MSGTSTAGASEGLSRTLVLNGLVDLCGGPRVLDDEGSRSTLAAAFEATLHVAERDKFERLATDEDPEGLDEEDQRFLATCAAEVLDELVDREVTATLLHDARLTVPGREAALYSFLVTHDPSTLDPLGVSDEVRSHLDAGAAAVADEAFADAVDAFEDAVTESAGGDGAIAARVLAAYASHRDGRDEVAMDYVEEALHLETRAWAAKLVGYAASHRYSEKFRTGKLGARVFFRWSTEVPDVGDVLVAVGPAGAEAEDLPDPTPVEGSDQCRPFERLWPETTVRVAVSGTLPEIPSVDSYYVATGVADLEVFEARSVEEVLLSGPASDDATERVRFDG